MQIAEPDPLWPAVYAFEAAQLRDALGPVLQALEHVGSTAVPGLPAKPVIDIMAAVERLDDAGERLAALAGRGYRLRATGMSGRLFLQRPPVAGRLGVNLHIVTLASWPTRKERLFRDRLRARPEEAAAYAALKRDLAARFGDDIDGYTGAKTALIQAIMDRAADESGEPRQDVWEA